MLNRKFKFYVPGTAHGVVSFGAQQRATDEVVGEFSTMFGGCTVTQATGYWLNPATGQTVREPITHVESFTDEEGYARHRDDVYNLAERLAYSMGQSSVAVEDCDELVLISAYVAEDAEAAIAA